MKQFAKALFLLLLLCGMQQAYCQWGCYGFRMSPPECKGVAGASAASFQASIERHNYDSAASILNHWEDKCGMHETILRARVALAIATGKNVDDVLPDRSMDLFSDYRERMNAVVNPDSPYYEYLASYYGFVPVRQEFDSFTRAFFAEALPGQQPYTTNYILSEFCGLTTDSLYDRIQDRRYCASKLAAQYYQYVKKIRNVPQTQWAVSAGVWIPTGGIARLGVHPEFGFQAGIKYGRVNVSSAWEVRFLRAKTGYYATRVSSDRSVVYTEKFFGLYMGLDGGYDVFYSGNHELQALLGIGYDGFDGLIEDKARDLESESVKSYNINFGVAYRYYVTNSLYLGLRVKYGVVDYTLNGVVDFTGNPVSTAVFIGGLEDGVREYLSSLKYKWR